MAPGQPGELLAHVELKILDQRLAQRPPRVQTLLRGPADDGTLDLKQGIDPPHDLDRDRGERDVPLAGGLAARVLLDVGHNEERPPRMRPARGLPDRSGLTPGQIELLVPVIGVGLQNAGIPRQMRLRMLAPAVARVVEHRRRWIGPAERPVVPHVNPASPRVGLALGQHRHGRIVGMQPPGGHHMGFEAAQQRIERSADRSHGVRHGR